MRTEYYAVAVAAAYTGALLESIPAPNSSLLRGIPIRSNLLTSGNLHVNSDLAPLGMS